MIRTRALHLSVVLSCTAALTLGGCAGAAQQNVPATTTAATPPPATTSVSPATTGTGETGVTVPGVSQFGQETASGTVVCTTYADRAKEVGYTGPGFENDSSLLTLLVLSRPIHVWGYYGGDYMQDDVSTICLPNDEMYRRFNGKTITIGVNDWGDFPSDVTAFLYDCIVDVEHDGLALVEAPA